LHVFQRLRSGGYVASVLDFVGVSGGVASVPFLLALAFAGGVGAAAAVPHLRRRDAAAFPIALVGWGALASQSPRLVEHGPSTPVAVAFVAGAAVLGGTLALVYRRG
jgi:hypothetical protein